ncbi:MAG: phosphatidylserine decarboxylase [Phycisphaerales bacterium]|nr:phosphatidylserine decarboxylase [Phycisphaerales bacterium]
MLPGPGSSESPFTPDLPAPPIAREGWPIIAAFILISLILSAAALWWLGPWGWIITAACAALTLWCIWFFRDPQRRIPAADHGLPTIVSPADGVICDIRRAAPPPELGLDAATADAMTRISVFMNVFNVHVNRAPIRSTVERIAYRPGKFFNASLDKASEHNERAALLLRLDDGRPLVCIQIAGLVARRIVCRVKEGARLATGQRFGLIRFGSRVDVYLPPGLEPLIHVGQPSVAGETILARLTSTAPPPSIRSAAPIPAEAIP